MRIRTRCIIYKLLSDYLELRSSISEEIDTNWKYYFSRSELFEILKLKVGAEIHNLALTGCTSEDLLEQIEDEKYIIQFILSQVKKMIDISDGFEVNSSMIEVLLNQTGQETHYLASKDFEEFDEYDISNLNSIFRKAGWLRKAYGIFNVKDELVQSGKHLTLFDTHSETLFAISRMVNEDDANQDDLLVKSKEVFLPLI